MDCLPQDIIINTLRFLEPFTDQISLALCSRRFLEIVSPSIRTLCIPYSDSFEENQATFLHTLYHPLQLSSFGSLSLHAHLTKSVERATPKYDDSHSEHERKSNELKYEAHYIDSKEHCNDIVKCASKSVFRSILVDSLYSLSAKVCISNNSCWSTSLELPAHICSHGDTLSKAFSIPKLDTTCTTEESLLTDNTEVNQTILILKQIPLLPSLCFLSLPNCGIHQGQNYLLDSALSHLSTLQTLEYLDISHCKFNPMLFLASDKLSEKPFASLKVLILEGCTQIEDSHLAELSPNLVHLCLAGCSVEGMNLTKTTSLIHLDLSQCIKLTENGVTGVASLKQLVYLSFRDCSQLTFSQFAIDQLQDLEHLDLCGCFNITEECMRRCACLSKLKYLDLTGPSPLSDVCIKAVVLSSQATLEWLSLNLCLNVGRQTIKAICGHCSSLRHLDIRGTSVDNAAFIQIGESEVGKNLHSLRVSCYIAPSNALCRMIMGLVNIEFLGLEQCYGVGDSVLFCIAHLSRLRGLSLYGCDMFNGDSLLSVVSSTKIEWLDVRLCWQIDTNTKNPDSWINRVAISIPESRNLAILVFNHNRKTAKVENMSMGVSPPIDVFQECADANGRHSSHFQRVEQHHYEKMEKFQPDKQYFQGFLGRALKRRRKKVPHRIKNK